MLLKVKLSDKGLFDFLEIGISALPAAQLLISFHGPHVLVACVLGVVGGLTRRRWRLLPEARNDLRGVGVVRLEP